MAHISKFIGLSEDYFVDFFVCDAEGLRYCVNEFLKNCPYLLCNRELNSFSGDFTKNSSDCLVRKETLGHRKDVVLNTAERCRSNLRGKISTLTFAKTKISFAVFEYDFQTPATGIDFPCFKKRERCISGKQTVPASMVCPSDKEDSYGHICKHCVHHDIVTLELLAVLFVFLESSDKLRSCKIAAGGMVFGSAFFTDLYHSHPMALVSSGVNEIYKILAGEPAVRQNIAKFDSMSDGTCYHLLGKLRLFLLVGSFALFEVIIIRTLDSMASGKFFVTHSIVTILSFFAYNVKIKKQLRETVSHCHAQTLEAKYGPMLKMGMYPAYHLEGSPGLVVIGVIDDEAHVLRLVVAADMNPVPQLNRDVPKSLAPLDVRTLHEAVENILLSTKQLLKSASFDPMRVLYPKIRKHDQPLEDRQQPVDTVLLALDS